MVSFVDAIYLAGTFGGVIMSVLPVLMLRSARKTGDMDLHAMRLDSVCLGAVVNDRLFCGAALYAGFRVVWLLPAAW